MRRPARWVLPIMLLELCLSPAFAEDLDRHGLFRIERNKNANIVQYDAMVEDGRLRRKDPVDVYWIRLAHDGETKKLSWVQRRFAYGFKAKLDKDSDRVTLDMVAEIERLITVSRVNGAYRAIMQIGDATCLVEKFYIDSSGSGMNTEVNYTEFVGTQIESGADCYEKLEP